MLPLKRLLSDEQSKEFLENYKEIFPELMATKLSLSTIKQINELSIDNDLASIKVPVLLGKAINDKVNSPMEMNFIYEHLTADKNYWNSIADTMKSMSEIFLNRLFESK